MVLNSLSLQHFRNYPQKTFSFSKQTTAIIGKNTAGKSNLIESIYLLATGKSFRAQNDSELLEFGQEYARVTGKLPDTTLSILFTDGKLLGRETPSKKYFVNDVPKRRVDFEGNLVVVLFSPSDLDLIIGSPSYRREFLDQTLSQIDRGYREALHTYVKALRQRNALLDNAREIGRKNHEQFAYWDELLITNGTIVTQKREDFITYMNDSLQEVFSLSIMYDKSIISQERLAKYDVAEMGAGVTLVGPHRDEVLFYINKEGFSNATVRSFGSRGQQRLAVLQLKLLQLLFMEKALSFRPLLLLDDIFSELDEGHINHVLSLLGKQQTILTTTHKEFLGNFNLSDIDMVELR